MSRVIVPLEHFEELENPESHVVLPVLSISEGPGSALAAMRSTQRCAVLATGGDRIVLLTAAAVAVARRSGVPSLGDINPTATFHPSPDSKMLFHEVFEDPSETSTRMGFRLQFRGNAARLITGSSILSLKYAGALRDLYCDGPAQHDTFPPPLPSEGDPCPYGDGYIVST
jgi:hypothetical protein